MYSFLYLYICIHAHTLEPVHIYIYVYFYTYIYIYIYTTTYVIHCFKFVYLLSSIMGQFVILQNKYLVKQMSVYEMLILILQITFYIALTSFGKKLVLIHCSTVLSSLAKRRLLASHEIGKLFAHVKKTLSMLTFF